MPRPKHNANAIPTEERILSAAEQIFGEQGFERSRLEDIAAGAGIRRPSLLYHFKSKDLLYTAVVNRVFVDLREKLIEEMKPREFHELVTQLTKSLIEFVEERPAMAPIVIREIVDGRGPAREILLKEISPTLDLVEKWIAAQGKGIVSGNLPIRAALLQLCSDIFLRASSGPLRHTLWDKDDKTSLQLTEILFYRS